MLAIVTRTQQAKPGLLDWLLAHPKAVLILALLGWLIGYWISCRWHPWTHCRANNCERGRRYGGVFKWGWYPCPACDGTGREVRAGTRLFWRETARKLQG